MIVELLIGTIVAVSCGGLAYLATRPKKKEEPQPEAPYKIEPPVVVALVEEVNVEPFSEIQSEPEKVEPTKVETLADYVAEVQQQEAVVEQPVKKKRKYTRKPKAAAGEQ